MDPSAPKTIPPQHAQSPLPARRRNGLVIVLIVGVVVLCLCPALGAAALGLRSLRAAHPTPAPLPTRDESAYYDAKKQALQRVLGPMDDMVYHSIIPFSAGGEVDLYFFPQSPHGTAVATMELIGPDDTGPKPSRIGTYELVMFTHLDTTAADPSPEARAFRDSAVDTLSTFGRYVFDTPVNPHDTGELPPDEQGQQTWLVFDEYRKPGVDFTIDGRQHGLLLCIRVFHSELEFATKNGTEALLERLKEKGYYPYSDLDRAPVA
jgi:hypothetical protein